MLRLDELYYMTAYIYEDKNIVRSREATFSHFVEVCGMLTVYDRKKKRESFEFIDALCKSLGWYFPLLAKLKIKSVEQLVFRKFPRVCPYCRRRPHDELTCKQVRGTSATVDHASLLEIARAESDTRPATLDEWQAMFSEIYPRNVTDGTRSTIGLMEELGELGEAIRVFDMHPHYFLGEAADIFSYLMGYANEHALRELQEGRNFSLQQAFIQRYPGLCTQCGAKVCCCPTIPSATIGRMAKELNIGKHEDLFISDPADVSRLGGEASIKALESLGGYVGLAESLPFDRGDTNRAIITLCLNFALFFEETNSELASELRAQALRIGFASRDPGTPRTTLNLSEFIDRLRVLWRSVDESFRDEVRNVGGLISELGDMFEVVRILFVCADPDGGLRLQNEQKEIRKALNEGAKSNKFSIDEILAATRDEFRRKLSASEFDIVHFSGHANERELIFDDGRGHAAPVPLGAFAEMIGKVKGIQCVILNACESVSLIKTSIADYTIGVDKSVDDDAAIEFSKGFYEALARGKNIDEAFHEGTLAVRFANFDSNPFIILKR